MSADYELAKWDIDTWGDDTPPENAAEIIEEANQLIRQYALTHPGYDLESYSAKLYLDYKSTGVLEPTYRDYLLSHPGITLSWCKTYVSDNYRVRVVLDECEDEITYLSIDGKEIDINGKSQNQLWNSIFGSVFFPEEQIALHTKERKELAKTRLLNLCCRDCPLFDSCPQMDELYD